eukprot:12445615-Heterocapsa_arctica.AAC.1
MGKPFALTGPSECGLAARRTHAHRAFSLRHGFWAPGLMRPMTYNGTHTRAVVQGREDMVRSV